MMTEAKTAQRGGFMMLRKWLKMPIIRVPLPPESGSEAERFNTGNEVNDSREMERMDRRSGRRYEVGLKVDVLASVDA